MTAEIIRAWWPVILLSVGAISAFATIRADVSRVDSELNRQRPIIERFYKVEEKVDRLRIELTEARQEFREYRADIIEGVLEVKKLILEKRK